MSRLLKPNLPASHRTQSGSTHAASFGLPTSAVLRHTLTREADKPTRPTQKAAEGKQVELVEWAGHMAKGTAVAIGRDRIADPSGELHVEETNEIDNESHARVLCTSRPF